MNDLVERLKHLANFWSLDFDVNSSGQDLPTAKACNEAATEIKRLQAENDVTKTAIATIAGQKLSKEMQNPEDGDYQYAYEEMIMVARRASDALKE